MDADNASIPETPKKGIGDSRTASVPTTEESAISGIQSEVGSPTELVPNRSDQINSGMTDVPASNTSEGSKLAWPPTAEDLRRLYLEQKLSAAKIAALYGLNQKYASPKTAESTILYHLKKNDISRRDRGEHSRKVTMEMEDDWIRRYESGESLTDIADAMKAMGVQIDRVSVFNHLRDRGLQLRDKVEAQIIAVTKFEKRPFRGDRRDVAYLVGLAKGDFYVTRHGRAIRVRLSTTHPAMAKLFREIFSLHGPIYEYPKQTPLTEFEWCLDCDLDPSFNFLVDLDSFIARVFTDKELFISFLAGFFDAEGSVYYHKKKGLGGFEFSLSNVNGQLLREITKSLSDEGFHCALRLVHQDPGRGVKNAGDFIWRLSIWRYGDVQRILRMIPSRHWEKQAKMKIALALSSRPSSEKREQTIAEWEALKLQIKNECGDYIEKARKLFLSNDHPKE